MVRPCPNCGRDDFGNEGARTNHVRTCDSANEPAVIEPESGEQTADRPANPEQRRSDGESLGSGIAATFDEDAPVEQRKEGAKNLAGLAGELISGVFDYRKQKSERQKKRAQESSVEQVTDKPQCECGAVFSQIPDRERIKCGSCGREYRVQ
jgi:hypothetical protein